MNHSETPESQPSNWQSLVAFNDALIKHMRVYFTNDVPQGQTGRQGEIARPDSPDPPTLRALEDNFHKQRRSRDTNISLIEFGMKGHPGFAASFSEACLPRSPDFDSSHTRRWENLLYGNKTNEGDAAGAEVEPPAPIREDFLTDEFSGKFDSDSEHQAERLVEVGREGRVDSFSFLTYAQSMATTFDGSSLFSLTSLIEKLESRNLRFRRYECDQCHRKFYNPAALGGHKSKQHPKSSKRYTDRKNVYSLRTGERRKRTFLNNL